MADPLSGITKETIVNYAKLYDQIQAMTPQQREETYASILSQLNFSDEDKQVIDATLRQHCDEGETPLSGLLMFAGMPVIPGGR